MAALLTLTISACSSDDEDITPVEVAYVSLYQASPDAPKMDIKVSNRQINYYPFEYTDNTGYLRFYPGSRELSFSPANADNIVADTSLIFQPNGAYSVFAVDDFENLRFLKLEDNSPAPETGKAMVRFVNLSPDAPALDLMSDTGIDPWFEDQAFIENSEFMEVNANSYNLTVKSSDDENISLNLPNVELQNGWFYTIIVRGYNTPPSGNSNVLSAEILVN